MKNGKWDVRISRANRLASAHPFASEGLRFYERVAQFQKSLYAEIESECGTAKEERLAGTLRQELDLFVLLPRFSSFLATIEKNAPFASRAIRQMNCAREKGAVGGKFWPIESRFLLAPPEIGIARGGTPWNFQEE